MRVTVTLDADLLAAAAKLAGPLERSALISAGLKALIERESARCLAKLGGSQPGLSIVLRRRDPSGKPWASSTASSASVAKPKEA